eukprot:1891260-Pleurochrysis_carterae.AAC.3
MSRSKGDQRGTAPRVGGAKLVPYSTAVRFALSSTRVAISIWSSRLVAALGVKEQTSTAVRRYEPRSELLLLFTAQVSA